MLPRPGGPGGARGPRGAPGGAGARPPPPPPPRFQRWLYGHRNLQLSLLLGLPLLALVVIYFGSLLLLLVNAFWTLDPGTARIRQELSLENFADILASAVYRTITLRTIGMALLVTVTCALLGFPVAYYMARIASVRTRRLLLLGVLLPLWASYLVKVFAWRAILQQQGVLNWLLDPLGLQGPGYGDVAVWLVFTYLWLPYMITPIYAGLERILPTGHPAARLPGGRGGVHLHVLADHG